MSLKYVVGPLDGPYDNDNPKFERVSQARMADLEAFGKDETLGCWKIDDGELQAIRWQDNWYSVA